MRLVLAQLAPKPGNVGDNLSRAIEVVETRCSRGTIIIFPELYLQGYMARDLLLQLAEPLNGPSINRLSRSLSDDCYALLGMAEKGRTAIFNAAVLVGPQGPIAAYRKRHLPSYGVFDEQRYFGVGWGEPPIVELFGRRLSFAVCYDAFFPELTRAIALKGVDAMLFISAAPDMSRDHFETLVKARAMENTVYAVYVNMVGIYEGLGFFGGSFVVDPLGKVLFKAPYYEEHIAEVELDPDPTPMRRIRPILKDVRRDDIELLIDAFEDSYEHQYINI